MFDSLFKKLEHLPVSTICDQVAEYFTNQMIPVVTSEVASGKTMLIPAACARALADDPIDNVVYVLQPTRFLSNNAAEALWTLLGDERDLVGVKNSSRSDDDSTLHPNNRLVFTTVGYALSSGILASKHNFILDEAHETSIDLSLAKAYLHARLERGDQINLAELSATIDVANELTYWGDNAIPFTTKGTAFPVEFLHRPAFTLEAAVSELITQHQRKGILVFVSGVEEIEDAVDNISRQLFHDNVDFEIETVHGNSSGMQRRAASKDRESGVKILVGTNVLESGVSLSWVDGGVSSGDTKVMYARGNVRRLHKENLPSWRIHQQMGRVARFSPGVFILAAKDTLESRPQMAEPDIVRLPLTELVMNCTRYPDIHVRQLKFTPREQPEEGAITSAVDTLVSYGLIRENDEGAIELTADGFMVQELPLSYRAAAALCQAVKLHMVAEMLPLIAAIDMGDMRQDYRIGMYASDWRTSDIVSQVMVIAQKIYSVDKNGYNRKKIMVAADAFNVSSKKYFEYKALVQDLERKTNTRAKWECYLPIAEEDREEFDRLTKQVIFRSMIVDAYPSQRYIGVSIPVTESKGTKFRTADKSRTTTVAGVSEALFYTGTIRIVTPKARGFSDARPFAVIEQLTSFSEKDVRDLIKEFGRPALERIAAIALSESALGDFLSGKRKEEPSIFSPSSFASTIEEIYDSAGLSMAKYGTIRRSVGAMDDPFDAQKYKRNHDAYMMSGNYGTEPKRPREEQKEPEPALSALGSALAAALNKNKK
jgi:HrpA-like RNA helicase